MTEFVLSKSLVQSEWFQQSLKEEKATDVDVTVGATESASQGHPLKSKAREDSRYAVHEESA